MKESRFGLVLAGLLLGIFMGSIDNTIVATAMGTIVAQLGGLDKFVWVTSAYMVTEMAGMPIFGKLSDMYGRKRFFVMGIFLFLLGSALCGTAHNIVQLSVYRAIQGIGGGALMPIAFTIIFDIIPPEQRGKMGGLFGAVFGLSSIFGPLLGAYITEYIDWRWVFYINVPIGLVALCLIVAGYHESLRHDQQIIDWWGGATLVSAVACMMFALQLGGSQYAWNSATVLGLFAASALLFILFFAAETKARDPVISYAMFRNRLFAGSTLVGLFSGVTFIVATIYIPIFIQGVTGGNATNSGLILLPMMLGTVVSSQVGAVSAAKFSYRSVMVCSGLVLLIGVVLLTTLTPNSTRLMVTLFMIVVGLGTGASFSVLSMAAIHNFDTYQRGSANSTIAFVREFGMVVGITVFGIIQRDDMAKALKDAFTGMGPIPKWATGDPHTMLSPDLRSHIPTLILTKLTDGLSSSIANTFLWLIIPAVLAVAVVGWMSGERLPTFRKKPQVADEPASNG